jgi:hypothetical protein
VALRLQSGVMHGVLASASCVDDKQGMSANAHIVNQINLMLIILFFFLLLLMCPCLYYLCIISVLRRTEGSKQLSDKRDWLYRSR